MLETPLFGRFLGENKYLIFAPAPLYLYLVGGCIGGGLLCAAWGMFASGSYFMILGLAVCTAGLWAALSLQWISFNLREKVYTRRQGPGLLPQTSRGKFSDLEAIFLLAEERLIVQRTVTYRLLLQWKGNKEQHMVLQQDYRSLPYGQPMNVNAGPMFHLGAKAANVLGIPIIDNAHFHSPCPVSFTNVH